MSGAIPPIRPVADGEEPALVELWHACGLLVPWNDPFADIALCRSRPESTVLVAVDAGDGSALAASVMVGHDGHRGWFYYLAVAPERRRRGLGRRMVAAGETWLAGRGVRKAQLLVRDTNTAVLGFYERLGYGRSSVVVMQKWLDRDSP